MSERESDRLQAIKNTKNNMGGRESDRLQALDNKARHDVAKERNREIVRALEEFLEEELPDFDHLDHFDNFDDFDPLVLALRLEATGVVVGEEFTRKSIPEMVEAVRGILDTMRKMFSGVEQIGPEIEKSNEPLSGAIESDPSLTDEAELEDGLDKKLENLVSNQYESAITLLQVSGLYDPSENSHPSEQRVKELLKKDISADQLEQIGKMENPVFQLVPNRTCAEYETALNKNKPMANSEGKLQVDAYVTAGWMRKAFSRADSRDKAQSGEITGWKVVITEGVDAPPVLQGDDISKILRERCAWFVNEFKAKGIQGIDIKSSMLLMMAGFLKNPPRPVDDVQGTDKTWTMLNAEEIFDSLVASCCWFEDFHSVNFVD